MFYDEVFELFRPQTNEVRPLMHASIAARVRSQNLGNREHK